MKLKPIAAALALAAGVSVSGGAAAFSLGGYQGPVKFVFSNFDSGTTGYTPTVIGTPETICATTAACDAKAGPDAPGSAWGEDTWGIFQISAIENNTGGILWTAGTGGEYLTGMFGGLTDQRVEYLGQDFSNNAVFRTASVGGWMKVFLDNVNDYSSAGGPTIGAGARTGQFTYDGATEGTLFLDLAFAVGGALAGDATSTYGGQFTFPSVFGSGAGFLNVVGGSHASSFDTNTRTDANGNIVDLSFNVTLESDSVWTATSTGQALGTVPEPASLALLGLGLAGLGFASRKKRA